MTVTVAALVADATWLPHRLSDDDRTITFVRLTREDHRNVTFLEDQYLSKQSATQTVPLAELAGIVPAKPVLGIDFIFHSSMALSTLVARLVDLPGTSMGLKEPIILNQLAERHRNGRHKPRLFQIVLTLLARPMMFGEKVIIKPGNVANRLISPIMAVAPTARALILHAPVQDFIRSIAKKGLPGRVAYRRLFRLLSVDYQLDTGFSSTDLFDQSDLQIAAMTWLGHHAQFARVIPTLQGRARSLSSDILIDRRLATVSALTNLFELEVDSVELAHSPVFDQHSKELGKTYDATQRAAAYAAVDMAYGEEITMVAQWTRSVAEYCGVPLGLPLPLIA